MNEGFWHKKQVAQICVFSAIVFIAEVLLFFNNLVSYPYIISGFIIAAAFFFFNNRIFHWWGHFANSKFELYLLTTAISIRILAAVTLYFLYRHQTGEPFEHYAVDSKFYHLNALKISMHLKMLDFNINSYLSDMPFSDRGYNVYLGTIYTFFNSSILASRTINALFSAITVLLIYRITKYIIGEHAARVAAIMALLLPNLLLYLGTGLKETVMLFIVTALIYFITKFVLLQQRTPVIVVSIIFLLFSLFMFRTVLAAVMAGSFIIYGLITNPLKNRTLNFFATSLLLIAFTYLISNSQAGNEISEYISRSGNVTDHMEFRATRDGGNKLAVLAGAPLFISVILMAPFPSFIYVPEQDILWMFIGGNLIRNVYAWFAILGIIYLIKKDFRKSSLILLYTLGYLGVLANSGFALSERFHFPAVSGLIILASAGITYCEKRYRKYFPYYLCVAGIMIIGWNYIKLAGRT